MKAFAFVLLCALAAVQGRYTGLESTRSAAALGENPWVVHLSIAVSTSGLLETCTGSLIDNAWVLTAASCVVDARFIWIRYGAVNIINPELVTESSAARVHPGYNSATGENNIALLPIGRIVHTTANIAPIELGGAVGDSVTFCGFGGEDVRGEQLSCYQKEVIQGEDGGISVSSENVSKFDIGASLVRDGVQVGLLVDESGNSIAIDDYIDWLAQEVRTNFRAEAAAEVAPEPVHFV